ncbi:MAG: hypothetical protein M3R24_39300, partial [Chloroflexota bacterium]|nr:hypothetical protein [Chloroflexota bacterium]
MDYPCRLGCSWEFDRGSITRCRTHDWPHRILDDFAALEGDRCIGNRQAVFAILLDTATDEMDSTA